MTEADTCRKFVTRKLFRARWGAAESVIGEQRSFTHGRIIVAGGKGRRGRQRRAGHVPSSRPRCDTDEDPALPERGARRLKGRRARRG